MTVAAAAQVAGVRGQRRRRGIMMAVMPEHRHDQRPADWAARDAERNEAAIAARLRRQAQRDPGRNVEDAAALIRYAQRFAAAFAARNPS
jgi:hypothetical protein